LNFSIQIVTQKGSAACPARRITGNEHKGQRVHRLTSQLACAGIIFAKKKLLKRGRALPIRALGVMGRQIDLPLFKRIEI
jgi:hypothetical protein